MADATDMGHRLAPSRGVAGTHRHVGGTESGDKLLLVDNHMQAGQEFSGHGEEAGMELRKAPIAFVASLAAAGTLWMEGAAGAKALDESCGTTGCSSSVNDSPYSATALFNWCGGGSTGTLTTTRPTCGNQKSMGLSPRGGHTPSAEDWDTLQIDGGWCYKVKFTLPAQRDNTTIYDRRGLSPAWVKVEDFSDAHVLDQSTSSCPA